MSGTTAVAPRGKLREALDYLLWFYTPFKRMSASDIYELVSTNAYSGQGLYLNLGYWKTARTIDEACVAMAMLVAETAGIGPDTDVVDVGFGFGDQDMLWVERLNARHITGLNITPSQVKLARERVATRGLSDRITLLEASATRMPLPDASCDRVVGVECAFHFDTREDFFREAFRVLRPGGRLVLADVIRAHPDPRPFRRRVQDFNWRFFEQKYAVPSANADTRESYAAKLTATGFAGARVDSIRHEVYPGLHHHMATDPAMLKRFHPLARLP
ncbi:MAG: methyltransferase domain-containing protein, partial [Rhodospirillales bacterium]|nr:methyltransferase domain-containing protein [Rhodospirillales bacterium]